MNKMIHIDSTGKDVERVLSIINEEDVEFNPTGFNYVLITDYIEPPELETPLSKNYAMYDIVNKIFKWVQVQYQNTATEEMLNIENLKVENSILKTNLTLANEQLAVTQEAVDFLIMGGM